VGTKSGVEKEQKMTGQLSLGEALFPRETTESKYNCGTPIFFTKIWELNNMLDIEDTLFLLKRSIGPKNVHYIAFCIAKVFEGLINYDLAERVQKWFPFGPNQTAGLVGLLRETRESIGKIALDVLFEAMFEHSDKAKLPLQDYLTEIIQLKGIYTAYGQEAQAQTTLILAQGLNPRNLLAFIEYFTKASLETKKGQLSKIRKFLKMVLDEPISAKVIDARSHTLAKIHVGISDWSEGARRQLAYALVANGMYEECIEYDLTEAQNILADKFIGKAFIEQDDGLVHIYVPESQMSVEEAMKKACNDREWRHIWSVLSTMEYKYGNAHLIRTIDPADPRTGRGTNAPLKLALMFDPSLEGGHEGF
jgi:tetratricopeptide (TPR) repeat protein